MTKIASKRKKRSLNAEEGDGEGEKKGWDVSGTTDGEGDERRYHCAPHTSRRTEREGRRREAQQDRPAVRHVGQRLGDKEWIVQINDQRRQVQANAVRGARVLVVHVRDCSQWRWRWRRSAM